MWLGGLARWLLGLRKALPGLSLISHCGVVPTVGPPEEQSLASSTVRGSQKGPCDLGGDVLQSTWRSKLSEVG